MKAGRIAATLILMGALSGCMWLNDATCAPYCHPQTHRSSSLVDFLYPNGQTPPPTNSVPQLHVPLRVGLSFLPSSAAGSAGLDAAHREELLERIAGRFKDRPFVADITLIPDYYLTNSRGFAGLEAVQRLYNLDLIALVSYDQVTYSDENRWSLGYLTIVGAYVVKGTRQDVSTLVDLAVVDATTRSLVLRAGGIDTRGRTTTLIDADQRWRASSFAGFDAATAQMIEHFDSALTTFQEQVRAGTANVRVVNRDGSARAGGAGAIDVWWIATLLPLAVLRVSVRRRCGRLSRAERRSACHWGCL